MEPYVGDVDTFFAYRTTRVVAIRDKYLGLGLISLQLAVGLFVVIYQVILAQNYMTNSDLVSSVRLQMKAPSTEFQWPNGDAPYCSGVTSLSGPRAIDFTIDPMTQRYAYTPNGNTVGATYFEQRDCEYLDETSAMPLTETDRVFLSSEERLTVQTVDAAACSNALSSPSCVFAPAYDKNNPNVTRRTFVADIEYFTLLVDHNMNAPLAGISYSVKQMIGRLLDTKSKPFNPCSAYSMYPDCPEYVAVGVSGLPDIVSIRTLLEAAGVSSLDALSGSDDADIQTTSMREAGVVLVLDIAYSNFYLGGSSSSSVALGSGSLDNSHVVYTYKISTVPKTEYKFITSKMPFNNETTRELWNRHGIRIIVTTSGKVGYVRGERQVRRAKSEKRKGEGAKTPLTSLTLRARRGGAWHHSAFGAYPLPPSPQFNLQNALISLSVSFSLVAIATYVMEFAMLNCCPLKSLYRQYKERATVDMTGLRKANRERPEAMAELKKRLDDDPYVFEPLPPALIEALGDAAGGTWGGILGLSVDGDIAVVDANQSDVPLLQRRR